MNIQDSPSYQRAMQRLTRLSPGNRGMVEMLANDTTYRFANDAMRQELASLARQANMERADESMSLRRLALDNRIKNDNVRLGQRQGALDLQDWENKWSTVAGLGQLGVAGWLGPKKLRADRNLAQTIYGLGA